MAHPLNIYNSPCKTLTYILLRKCIASSGKKKGIDAACGDMENNRYWPGPVAENYVGFDSDCARVSAAAKKKNLNGFCSEIESAPSILSEAEFVVCTQCLNINSGHTESAYDSVRNLVILVAQGGDLYFNVLNKPSAISTMKQYLNKVFSDVFIVEYGAMRKVLPCKRWHQKIIFYPVIFISAWAMYFIPTLRDNECGSEKYYFFSCRKKK